MTIITALYDGKNTWLGHNDGMTFGDTPVVCDLQPWIMFGDWALGITGMLAQQNILENHLPRLAEAGQNAFSVAEAIRGIFSDYGHWSFDEENAMRSYKMWCILAHKDGQIWDLDSFLTVSLIPKNKLWARGSGTDYALGADSAFYGLSLSPEERVTRATRAAIECDIYCPGEACIFKF